MIIDIWGGGALGLLFYSKISAHLADNQLNLWCRTQEQVDTIHSEGIVFREHDTAEPQIMFPNESSGCNVYAVHSQSTSTLLLADLIIVTIKQTHLTASFIQQLQTRVKQGTAIICLQNGVRADNPWPESWQVYAAITTEGAKKSAGNHITHAGYGQTVIGRMDSLYRSDDATSHMAICTQNEHAHLSFLINLFQKAGFQSSLSKDIGKEVYRKLIINAVINPLTAIWRVPNGELLASHTRVELMRQLFMEAVEVYRRNHIPYSEHWWDDILNVCRATASNTSSMLADVQHNRRTEIAWINGTIIEMARRTDYRAEAHEWMYRFIEPLTLEEAP
ncbi:ketopantoate reductase family protein [Paenibacillus sp. WLX1005]|uniref:ketopantoate reductase family protein n=1 Tax=Paenibacillus sp. WLX1005 TaxID=3243766 RepID=UPI00398437C2